MSQVAFELRADVKDFSGGTVSVNGEAVDLTELLKGGKIVLDPVPSPKKAAKDGQPATYDDDELARAKRDEQMVDVLDAVPALKRTTPDSGSDKGGDS